LHPQSTRTSSLFGWCEILQSWHEPNYQSLAQNDVVYLDDDARSTRLVVLDPVRFFLRDSAEKRTPRAVESAMGLGDSARVPREAPSHLRNVLSLASDAHPTGSTGRRCESGHSWSR
jgi:hypothetical protein